ncbi:MAG TPA: hypothetical protein VGO73_08940 [Pyrinomonadaceae bacterium]|jgi:hypothetical protein|nr:hypothetical protein [Pyrinomonadaceae bacterium]
MQLLSSIRLVRVGLALAVAFWMAGGGCMLGCKNMVAVAASSATLSRANSPTIVAAGEACASMHAHDCCARHGAKPAPRSSVKSPSSSGKSRSSKIESAREVTAVTAEFDGTSTSMMDCPLAVNASAALSKAKQDQSNSALLLTRANGPLPNPAKQATALSPPLRLPNRGHTYLHCCVFLI